MEKLIRDVNNLGKSLFCLVIAENVIEYLDESDNNYSWIKEGIQKYWSWIKDKNVKADDLCDYIDDGEGNALCMICLDSEGTESEDIYATLLMSLSYIAWQAYNEEHNSYPQILDNIDDRTIIDLYETLNKSKSFDKLKIDKIKSYFLEEYSAESSGESSNINRENILNKLK